MRILFCLLLLISSQCFAQKQKFAGSFQLGYLNGKDQSDAQLTGAVSVVKHDWQLGLTTGIDNYKIRSIPILFSVEKYFSRKINKPFLYSNQGLNVPWKKQTIFHNDAVSDPKYKPGLMFEAGGGYALKLKYQRYFVFSVGYSMKVERSF
jgi:opacity protein-like surface antigen